MSILVRREKNKYFFRLKNAVNYGTVKRQAGAEVSIIKSNMNKIVCELTRTSIILLW